MYMSGNRSVVDFSKADLLTDIFSELLGPIVIIGRDRSIIFKSRAFEDIVGTSLGDDKLSCDLLILPGITGCCIDAIDSYPDETRSGIWNLKQQNGGIVPVLATWRPVNVGAQLSLLAIQCTPIPSLATPVSLGFFRGIRKSSGNDSIYMQRSANYLHRAFDYGAVAWFDLADNSPIHSIGLNGSETRALTDIIAKTRNQAQDIIVSGQSGYQVFHLFTNCDTGRKTGLVVGKMSRDIDNKRIDSLTAAVTSATPSGDDKAYLFETEMDFQSTFEIMTPAEADILDKLLLGMTDKEIAVTREVSPYTVKNQVKRVLKKAGAQRRIELIRRFTPSKVHCRN